MLLSIFGFNSTYAGILVSKTNGITFTGADGITFTGADGITFTGADEFLSYKANGITFTGADGITFTGADGITLTGADTSTYTGTNGITFTGADGITFTGADGITFTGADGITFTGADGVTQQADSVVVRRPNGITFTGADGITLTGADGFEQVGSNGITFTGADGITFTGADGITFTGADGITFTGADGTISNITSPSGITFTGADGITLTGADGITFTGADGITFTGADKWNNQTSGFQSVDPELLIKLNEMTNDSNINAVIVFHHYPTDTDFAHLRQIGIVGGTRFRRLPFVSITASRDQLIAVSHLSGVRSIFGNRSLSFNSDPFFNSTGTTRVAPDRELQTHNHNLPITGRNVTVAVLDTGVNGQHNDLAGHVTQNVRLTDTQSAGVNFLYPVPIENVTNTDPISGHGTFVAGIVAASGAASGGKYSGVAPGAKILGLSAGDANLTHVLSGFDYLLEHGSAHNVRVVNCSFSANTIFDYNDPVNVATKMLTENGINVVFSAGNTGSGNATLNPYAAAPWVVSVGATDEKGRLASFSSRGIFGNRQFSPSLVAPGVNVASLRSSSSQTGVLGVAAGADASRLTPGEIPFYTTASGTSFSAPQVAGAIALMLEANPNLNPEQIKDILQRTATPLPPFYLHEVGAGMLNVHAAVLESAFPARRIGLFRASLDQKQVKFITDSTKYFNGLNAAGARSEISVNIPNDAVQTTVHMAWGGLLTLNDLGLKLFDDGGNLRGESNYLNLPGLNGRREKTSVNAPSAGVWKASVSHTGGIGTNQEFFGAIETTRVEFAPLSDVQNLSAQMQAAVKDSVRSFVMLPSGKHFRPMFPVSRAELAQTLIRGGRVPQYIGASPLFTDVRDLTTRQAVESVQKFPTEKLFFDASSGGAFRPNESATRLVTAVALVKAANLQSLAASTPLIVADAAQIPVEWRGYVAVALQHGLLSTDGANFAPNRSLTRIELTQAMVKLNHLAMQ
ncbi:MAG: S8 family serine peptidase [Acidobacteriota bacterium]|nr:S8 family serine peptidase [Acidobacteriota bacterium]